MARKAFKGFSLIIFAIFFVASIENSTFAADASSVVSSGTLERAAQHVWTAEEMRSAKPMPLPALPGKPESSSNVMRPTGVPGLVPSGRPANDQTTPVVEQEKREPVFLDEIDPLGYTYPFPFTRLEVFPIHPMLYKNYYPYKAIGKVFFYQNGISYMCSGCSIGNRGVWTAGHCVSDGAGTWSTDFVFAPAYRDGNSPWGQWQAEMLATLNGWHSNSDFSYDMGGAKVYEINYQGNWYKLSQAVGWLGFAWNWPREQHWNGIGYPAADPFDGNRQIVCQASHATDDTYFDPATIGIGCDQTGGCSGGSWIKDFSPDAGAANYLNGNFSYHYLSEPDAIYSPYFGDAAKTLWDALTAD